MRALKYIGFGFVFAFVLACGVDSGGPSIPKYAEASDADLQQYNRPAANAEAANAASALTSTLLLPTDGKLITADSNSAGKAPVNRSLKELGDLIAGVRCMLLGNCSGVNRRTAKSFEVDGVGGAVSTIASGVISGHSLWGSIVAIGPTLPTGQQTGIDAVSFNWLNTGTTSSDANPPRGTSIKNALRAKSIPKYWMRVTTNASNTVTNQEGAGNWSASIVDTGLGTRYRIRFTLGDAMSNVSYAVTCSTMHYDNGFTMAVVYKDTLTTGRFDVGIVDFAVPGGAFINTTNTATDLSCVVYGQQDT